MVAHSARGRPWPPYARDIEEQDYPYIAYGLPNKENAVLPRRNNRPGYFGAFVTAAIGVVAGLIAFRSRADGNGSSGTTASKP